jgi:hypothetical protein
MKNVITYFDVADPIGKVYPGGIVILKGDAPVWRYCNLMYKCIMEGAAVVAIAHGIDTTHDGGAAIVAYSTDENYYIGKTLQESPNATVGRPFPGDRIIKCFVYGECFLKSRINDLPEDDAGLLEAKRCQPTDKPPP